MRRVNALQQSFRACCRGCDAEGGNHPAIWKRCIPATSRSKSRQQKFAWDLARDDLLRIAKDSYNDPVAAWSPLSFPRASAPLPLLPVPLPLCCGRGEVRVTDGRGLGEGAVSGAREESRVQRPGGTKRPGRPLAAALNPSASLRVNSVKGLGAAVVPSPSAALGASAGVARPRLAVPSRSLP